MTLDPVLSESYSSSLHTLTIFIRLYLTLSFRIRLLSSVLITTFLTLLYTFALILATFASY